MTNTAAAEAKKTIERPVAVKEKKDVAEKKTAKPEEKKKEEKPAEVTIKQPQISDEVKPEPASTDATKVKTHTVQKGDTYFNLTRKYELEFTDIKTLNNLSSTDLKLGQVIIVAKPDIAVKQEEEGIPANAHIIDISKEVAKKEAAKLAEPVIAESKAGKKKEAPPTKEKTKKVSDEKLALKEEKVVEKETHNTVAEKVVTPEQEAEKPDAIVAKTIEVQQPDVAVKDAPQPEKTFTAQPVISFLEEYGNSYNKLSGNNNYKIQKTRGVAEYTESISGNEYLAYYNNAEPGSIVKITNLMNRQSAYVKVMGGISTTENDENVALKISKKLAMQLQVLDDKFLVEVSRYAKN